MYAREVEGQVLTFGVSGKLIMNGLVMYDDETDTLWSQVLGEAVRGPLLGTRLKVVPSTQTTWDAWQELYPDTLVLDKEVGYYRDRYESYYRNKDAGIIDETIKDRRLESKEYVIGVTFDKASKAYPFNMLRDFQVVNDTVGHQPILVVYEPESGTGLVYDRTIYERVHNFYLVRAEGVSEFVVSDRETGSQWLAFTGEAIEGDLAGETLTRLPSTYIFWFGWSDYHPTTEVFEGYLSKDEELD